MHEHADQLDDCHSRETVSLCLGCGKPTIFSNRCDRFYCPACQPRLTRERITRIAWWVCEINQPKHIVLTVRNIKEMTRGHVQEFKKWILALRRSKFARSWKGGLYSVEVTNEGKGWHLHAHLLVDVRYVAHASLKTEWLRVTRGAGKIVWINDARSVSYLKEVTKYCVKGSQLAAWSPDKVRQFINSFSGVRTFGVFGSLYNARPQFAKHLEEVTAEQRTCECGSCNFKFFSPKEWELWQAEHGPPQYGHRLKAPLEPADTEGAPRTLFDRCTHGIE
jgi:hypothetical protein